MSPTSSSAVRAWLRKESVSMNYVNINTPNRSAKWGKKAKTIMEHLKFEGQFQKE